MGSLKNHPSECDSTACIARGALPFHQPNTTTTSNVTTPMAMERECRKGKLLTLPPERHEHWHSWPWQPQQDSTAKLQPQMAPSSDSRMETLWTRGHRRLSERHLPRGYLRSVETKHLLEFVWRYDARMRRSDHSPSWICKKERQKRTDGWKGWTKSASERAAW